MGEVRHRIGLGTVGSAITGKNDITAKGTIVLTPPFTFDSTVIKMDSTVRTFDESII